jgi:serine/threonine protein kinase
VIGTTVSHYSALWNPACQRNPRQRDKILEKLGGGGMGEVYKAQNTRFDRPVAAEVPPSDPTRDHESREGFLPERRSTESMVGTMRRRKRLRLADYDYS